MGRLLVTGANGLVGSQFKGDLVPITSKMVDLRDKKSTEDIINFYTDKEKQGMFAIDKIIADISQYFTLKVGDLIFTLPKESFICLLKAIAFSLLYTTK